MSSAQAILSKTGGASFALIYLYKSWEQSTSLFLYCEPKKRLHVHHEPWTSGGGGSTLSPRGSGASQVSGNPDAIKWSESDIKLIGMAHTLLSDRRHRFQLVLDDSIRLRTPHLQEGLIFRRASPPKGNYCYRDCPRTFCNIPKCQAGEDGWSRSSTRSP